MKYWGKKPHNIWSEYINFYTSKKGIIFDPFSGSGMAAFEALIDNRRAVAFDLNPLTTFFIDVFISDFNYDQFMATVNEIVTKIKKNNTYKKMYEYKGDLLVHNVKYLNDEPYEIALISSCGRVRKTCKPNKDDLDAISHSKKIKLCNKYPNEKFRNSSTFSKNFLNNIGETYDSLFTIRNLFVLSEIFKEILNVKVEDLKKQLLFNFIKIVHLCTKMAVPRNKKANRDFSTSWGRPAYIYSKKQMEMNPLILFENAASGRQSTASAITNFKKRLGRKINCKKVEANGGKVDFSDEKVDLFYGKVDIKKINNILPDKSVDFILTDPPYGGVIQYLDLSSIWLSWLELYDDFYIPNYDSEIIINSEKDTKDFEKDMTIGLSNLHKVLKDEGKMVLTFNNKDLSIWNSFIRSINASNFKIEKIIHQQNRRTGESNVSDPYGSSASDFYVRCVKGNSSPLKKVTAEEFESILVKITTNILEERNEPTPFQVLLNGVLASIFSYNIDYGKIKNDFSDFLNKHDGILFFSKENYNNRAGNFWWVNENKSDFKNVNNLTSRLEKEINNLFEIKKKISEKELYEYIYKVFPNGLCPDPTTIRLLLKDKTYKKGMYLYRKGGNNDE
jgi:16S rRNA G966 N2-methylase RsmD